MKNAQNWKEINKLIDKNGKKWVLYDTNDYMVIVGESNNQPGGYVFSVTPNNASYPDIFISEQNNDGYQSITFYDKDPKDSNKARILASEIKEAFSECF